MGIRGERKENSGEYGLSKKKFFYRGTINPNILTQKLDSPTQLPVNPLTQKFNIHNLDLNDEINQLNLFFEFYP